MKHQLGIIAVIICLTLGAACSGNAQWVSTNGPATKPVTCFSVLEGGLTVLAGVRGGIYLDNTTWVSITRNLASINPQVVAMDFSNNGNNIFIGTNTGGVYFSSNGGDWNSISPNSGIVGIFSLAVKGTDLYLGTDGSFWRSTDNGTTWKGLSPPVSQGIVTAISSSGQNLFGVDNGVYISSDNGTSWTLANSGLPSTINTLSTPFFGNLYAGTNDGVYVTTNNGTSWLPFNNGMAGVNVNSIASDGVNIYAGTSTGGVYFSSIKNANWKAANTGLPTMKINALAVAGQVLLAATDVSGVWRRLLSEFVSSSVDDSKQNDLNISISPNPSTGIITVYNASENIQHVSVRNILGENILELTKPNTSEFMIDLSKFSTGIYTATFTTSNSVITKKIIRE